MAELLNQTGEVNTARCIALPSVEIHFHQQHWGIGLMNSTLKNPKQKKSWSSVIISEDEISHVLDLLAFILLNV